VRFGHRTIKDGEAAAVWNYRGELTEVVGPRRVTLWFSTIRFLYHHQASRGQYLKVQHRDGTIEHVVGPVSMYQNPTLHKDIDVLNGFNLATEDDCLVVYGSDENNDKGLAEDRRVIYGPQFVTPSNQETVHVFDWSGLEGYASSFQVLKTNKIELWKIELPLKTLEGPIVNVNLAISYKIETIDKCLDIADPIAHIQAAIFCDANRGDISMSDVSRVAGNVSTYQTFDEAMRTCGFHVLKMHVTNVSWPQSLVEKHQKEKQESERQSKASARLQQEMDLTKLEFEKKRGEAEEQATLDKIQSQLDTEISEQSRHVLQASVENEVLLSQMRQDAKVAALKQENETRLEYLQGLHEMGVDLTKVLCAEVSSARSPFRVDSGKEQHVGIQSAASSGKSNAVDQKVNDDWESGFNSM